MRRIPRNFTAQSTKESVLSVVSVQSVAVSKEKWPVSKTPDTGLLLERDLDVNPNLLEDDPQTELHHARLTDFSWQVAECSRIAGVEVSVLGIAKLVMVQNVGKDNLEFRADPLSDSKVLSNAQIHVPVRQAAQDAKSAVLRIHT